MIRPTHRHAAALAVSLLCAAPAAAQSLVAHETPAAVAGPERASFHVRLRSAWPQLSSVAGCENGGGETVEGVLTRTPGGDYAGTFTRRTNLRFCGAHGAGGEACALVLEGDGNVAMRGIVVDDGRIRVVWTPDAEHAAKVRGACGAEFKQAVRRTYLTVRHGAEFTLPVVGAAPLVERLEDYPWTVEVE